MEPIKEESNSSTEKSSAKKHKQHIKYIKTKDEIGLDFAKSSGVHRGFGKFKRKLIFLLLCLINILLNMDHGAIPAGTTVLMKELNLDYIQLGIIGSLVFLGLTLGISCI